MEATKYTCHKTPLTLTSADSKPLNYGLVFFAPDPWVLLSFKMFFSENKAMEQDCCPPKRVSSISHHYPIPGLRSKHVFIFWRLKHSKESLSGSLGSKPIWFSLDFVSWFSWSGDTIAKDVHQYNGSSCCLFQYYSITFSADVYSLPVKAAKLLIGELTCFPISRQTFVCCFMVPILSFLFCPCRDRDRPSQFSLKRTMSGNGIRTSAGLSGVVESSHLEYNANDASPSQKMWQLDIGYTNNIEQRPRMVAGFADRSVVTAFLCIERQHPHRDHVNIVNMGDGIRLHALVRLFSRISWLQGYGAMESQFVANFRARIRFQTQTTGTEWGKMEHDMANNTVQVSLG